jgi:hypothetical protein
MHLLECDSWFRPARGRTARGPAGGLPLRRRARTRTRSRPVPIRVTRLRAGGTAYATVHEARVVLASPVQLHEPEGESDVSRHPFRFGVTLLTAGPQPDWQAKTQLAADLGYDIVQAAGHLDTLAPFPALVSAGSVPDVRVGTFVLNAGLYRPALLARDVAATSRLLEDGSNWGLAPATTRRSSRPPGCPSAAPASVSIIWSTPSPSFAGSSIPCLRCCWLPAASEHCRWQRARRTSSASRSSRRRRTRSGCSRIASSSCATPRTPAWPRRSGRGWTALPRKSSAEQGVQIVGDGEVTTGQTVAVSRGELHDETGGPAWVGAPPRSDPIADPGIHASFGSPQVQLSVQRRLRDPDREQSGVDAEHRYAMAPGLRREILCELYQRRLRCGVGRQQRPSIAPALLVMFRIRPPPAAITRSTSATVSSSSARERASSPTVAPASPGVLASSWPRPRPPPLTGTRGPVRSPAGASSSARDVRSCPASCRSKILPRGTPESRRSGRW